MDVNKGIAVVNIQSASPEFECARLRIPRPSIADIRQNKLRAHPMKDNAKLATHAGLR